MATPPTFPSGAILTAAQMNQIGLWLVKSQAVGSGVSSVAITNAFSSDFDHYRVCWVGGTLGAGSGDMTLQLTGSSSGYDSTLMYHTFAATGTFLGARTTNGSGFLWVGGGDTNGGYLDVELYGPYNTVYTTATSLVYNGTSAEGKMLGRHNSNSIYSGFSIYQSSGTMSGGTIQVYGYHK